MEDPKPHIVTLDLTDADRHAILINALQDYASDALDKAQEDGNTTAEQDHFQNVATIANQLADEIA